MERKADGVKRFRGCINDLLSVLALSAMRSGDELSEIVGTLLDVLLRMLRLVFAYVRRTDGIDGSPIELVRLADKRSLAVQPGEVGHALNRWLTAERFTLPSVITHPGGRGALSRARFGLGLEAEVGVVVAGSRRADFPTEIDTLLLRGAANQTATGLQAARRRRDQNRATEELERRVAERTADLRRVNEQLRAENAERKRAEDALQRSEAYLAEAQRISHTGSFGWHVSSGELFWSDETYRIAGVDRATRPTVEQVLQRIHPEDVVAVQETLDRASRDGTDLDFEHRFLMPDGSVTYVHVVAHAMTDEQGDLAYVGAVTDVTAATRSQQALERAFQDMQALKDQHRLVIDTIPGLVWSTLPDGHADFLNQRWLDYTGLSLAEAQGWGWTAALHPEDRAGFVEKWRTALATGEPWEAEARWRRADGEYRWFHVRSVALRDESRNIVRWYAVSTDIDDRKRAEEQLLLTKYSIDHSADYAFWAAPDARLVFVNDAGCNALGYTRDELLKLTVHDINPEFPSEAWEDHWKGLRASQSLSLESKLRRKNGQIFPVELSLNYLLYNGQEYGFCFARDITQRQQRDEEMQRLTTRVLQLQDEERRRIARDLHDVTAQDLGAVAVNLALLRRLVTDLKPEAQNIVTESASLAEAVLQQIRTLSYLLHPPLLDQVGLASALRWYVEGFTKRSGIHVDIEISRDIGRPSLDIETALFRIVQESLTNVHRHSGSGSATIRLVRAGERMALHVKDQGSGMIDGAIGAIADHVQSLGLGILGMRQRLRQFGGQLEIQTSHHGTEIIATVPLTSAPTGQPGQGQRSGE